MKNSNLENTKDFNIVIIQPPLVQLNTPYPSGAYLLSFFNEFYKQNTFKFETQFTGNSFWFDLSTTLFHKIFSKNGLSFIFEKTKSKALSLANKYESQNQENAAFQLRRYINQSQAWIEWIDIIIQILCTGNREYTHEFVRSAHVPRGNRMEEYLVSIQRDVSVDDCQILASLALADLADYITAVYDENFSLIRYAEHLATEASNFDKILNNLSSPILIDFLQPLLKETLSKINGKTLFCISIPFSGTFESALFIAKHIKENFQNECLISFGGGYINTELREITEKRLFNYCDFISYDKGYGSYLHLLKELNLQNIKSVLNGKNYYNICYLYKDNIINPLSQQDKIYLDYQTKERQIIKNLIPDFSQIDFTKSPKLTDDTNPMHRIWNDGSWIKAYMAYGCYWHRCAFCDTTLDYVKDYCNTNINNLFKGLYSQAQKTNIYGLHFVDEACPPVALEQFAIANCNTQKRLTYWGNIRFEKTFNSDLADILSYGGLTAVSAGIEIATGTGLSSINKGTDMEHIVSACCAFKEAGILVHSYMIFGFWNQNEQDLINSMETLRQLFLHGLLDSAFWHKFSLTKHSTVYKEWQEGKHKELKPIKLNKTQFAQNELHFEGEHKSEKYSAPLNTALHHWMHGINLNKKVCSYFPFKMPEPSISKNYIENLITKYEQNKQKIYNHIPLKNQKEKYVWIGGTPIILNKNELSWIYKGEQFIFTCQNENINKIENLLINLNPKNIKTKKEIFYSDSILQITGKSLFTYLRGKGLCKLI